jgi:glycosyltransferase involved in cell wall biosynthesis
MKVLHVIPTFAPAWRYGGPIVAAVGLTRELARQGHDVTVMTTNIDGRGVLDVPVDRSVDMDGVEVRYFPVQRPRWYYFSRPLGHALRERVGGFDIVHIHSIFLWPTTIAAYWSRRRNVPYLVRPAGALDPVTLAKAYAGWRTSVSSRLKKWLFLHTIGRWDLNGASGIHFTSEAEMEASGPLRLVPPKYVLPLGVTMPPGDSRTGGPSLSQQHPALQRKKIVLFLSSLDPVKGADILVSAMGSLAARDDFALLVAGQGDAAYETQIASLVRAHGLQDRTVFLGFVEGDDKWSVLSQADIFVLPSHHENFGVAVAEAMASGLPVIISDRVNIHQEVSDAGAGLVTSLDPEEVAGAVQALLDNEDLRKKMGGAGEALARERFSWERAAGRIARQYEAIVESKHRTASGAVRYSVK